MAISLKKDHVMEPRTRQSIPASIIGHQFTKRPCDGATNKTVNTRVSYWPSVYKKTMRWSHEHDSQYQSLLLAISLQKDHEMEPGTRQSIPESLIGHQFTKRPCDGATNTTVNTRVSYWPSVYKKTMRWSHEHDSQYQRLLLAISLQKDHVMEPRTRQSIPASLIGHQFTKRPCDGATNTTVNTSVSYMPSVYKKTM